MGKVVHVSTDLHARIKGHCEQKNISLSVWAAKIFRQALSDDPYVSLVAQPIPVEMKKHSLGVNNGESEGSQLWSQPPFWERKQRSNEESNDTETIGTNPGAETESPALEERNAEPRASLYSIAGGALSSEE